MAPRHQIGADLFDAKAQTWCAKPLDCLSCRVIVFVPCALSTGRPFVVDLYRRNGNCRGRQFSAIFRMFRETGGAN
jgi:hypothetical protein